MTELGLQVYSHRSDRLIHCYGVILMSDAFFGAIFASLIFLGLVALVCGVILKLLAPREKYEYCILIPSKHCPSGTISAAYAAKMKMALIGDESFGRVIVVDTGMDEAEKLSCLNVCRESNGIFLMTPGEVEDYLK